MRKIIFSAAVFLLLMQMCSAQDYYADSFLVIEDDGNVIISGVSNHPRLTEGVYPEYTSKNGAVWTVNISFPEVFSEYVYEAVFPERASVSYLNVPKSFRMEEKNGRIHLIAVGKEERFFMTAQYTISAEEEGDNLLIIAAAFIVISSVGLVMFCRPKKKKASYDKTLLTDRQREIMEFLEKEGGRTTQARMQQNLPIPKASLSRNIDSLARKGIIRKEKTGMSNTIMVCE